MTAPVTIDFDEETLTALDSFAVTMELSRSELIKLAIGEWLMAQTWNLEEIEAGIGEADRGEFASDKEVAAVLAKYRGAASGSSTPGTP